MVMINRSSILIATAVLLVLTCMVASSMGGSDAAMQTTKTKNIFTKTMAVGFSDIRSPKLQDFGTLDVSNYSKIRVESRITGADDSGLAGEVRLYRPGCTSCVVEAESLGPMLSSRIIEIPGTDLQVGAFLFDSASPSSTPATNSTKPPIAVEVTVYGSQ